MRLRLFILIAVLSLSVALPTAAQEGSRLPLITVDNVKEVRQLRVLNDVQAWDAAWSPSGSQLAIGTLDGVIMCQCDSFENPAPMPGLEGVNAYRLAWSPDGKWLVTGTAGTPAQVLMMDMSSGGITSVEMPADVLSLAFSPDSSLLAVGMAQNQGVTVLAMADASEVVSFPSEVPVETIAFTPDGRELVYPPTRETLRRQPLDGSASLEMPVSRTATDMYIIPNGGDARLATTTFDKCIYMFNLDSGELLYRRECGQTSTIDFNSDGSLLVTGNYDGTMHFLQGDDGEAIATMNAHDDYISRLSFHPDGTRLVTVGLDNTVRVFGVPSAAALTPCEGAVVPEGDPVGEIVYHTQPLTGGPGELYHVQAWCGKHVKLLDGALYPAWSPDGSQIAFQYVNPDTGQFDGLWLAKADGTNLRPVPGSLAADRAPAWSPDGKALAFESFRDEAHGIYIVDLETGDVREFVANPSVVYERPAWSPDGTQIAYILQRVTANGQERYLFVADASGDNPRRVTDLAQVMSVDWSPDGTKFVIAAQQTAFTTSVIVVDAASGDYAVMTDGSNDMAPVWSPDGNHIAFVRGDMLMIVRADGEDAHFIVRLADTYGTTGLSWKALAE